MKLYPEIKPYHTEKIKVSKLHTIYVEQAGNPNGKPVLFLHGGPGGGLQDDYRRFFDPEHYRVILLDQRGCGQSTPFAEIKENSTPELINDLELIRKKYGIDKWIVFGGSWGSTLALCYGIAHPEAVKTFVLRGLFFCRPKEIKWFYQEGSGKVFPEAWAKYVAAIPENERDDFVKAYYKRLTSDNKQEQLEASWAWSYWEDSTSTIKRKNKLADTKEDKEFALAFARIECHYFINKIFYDSDNYILDNIDKIKHIPAYLFHGRYDMVCPVENAFELQALWPGSQLKVLEASGHSLFEAEITEHAVDIMEELKD